MTEGDYIPSVDSDDAGFELGRLYYASSDLVIADDVTQIKEEWNYRITNYGDMPSKFIVYRYLDEEEDEVAVLHAGRNKITQLLSEDMDADTILNNLNQDFMARLTLSEGREIINLVRRLGFLGASKLRRQAIR